MLSVLSISLEPGLSKESSVEKTLLNGVVQLAFDDWKFASFAHLNAIDQIRLKFLYDSLLVVCERPVWADDHALWPNIFTSTSTEY